MAVLSGLIGAATSVWQVAVLRAGAWTARGLRVPSRNALLADATPKQAYGRAYGFERMMDNLGAIGGPLLALALVAAFSVRTAIQLSIIPGLFATFAIIYAIRRLPKAEVRERQPIRLKVRPVLQAGLGPLLAAVGAFELGNVAATLLILRATQLLTPTDGTDSVDDDSPAPLHRIQHDRDAGQRSGRVTRATGSELAAFSLEESSLSSSPT